MLSADWLEKWNRSAAKFPKEIPEEGRAVFEKLICDHEQFRNLARPERLPETTIFRRDSGLA
jgi:hypothetical protein